MAKRDIGTDDPRVRVRPGKGSRPRTKVRPDYSDAPKATVISVDRGRFRLVMDEGTAVTAVKARELGKGAIVVGDRVSVKGDVSGKPDTLARIVQVQARKTALLRSAEDGETKGNSKVLVANAELLMVVVALADPPPRVGMIDRLLVAAYAAGMTPIICLTKADLASPEAFRALYEPLGVRIFTTALGDSEHANQDNANALPQNLDYQELREFLKDRVTVLVGHSGVGKSTLFNALIPKANRPVGHVNENTGKGRHTSTSTLTMPLPEGGYLIDTPGVRSFGLAHVTDEGLLAAFTDLSELATACPKGCPHTATSPNCELDEWLKEANLSAEEKSRRESRVASFRRLLESRQSTTNNA
ncbi:ribosome small subunit-dependent GTPase A [Boudabousia liubingyangii]|uniref:Small ribosomal subunit biogenesis GTPase RsgA n=1 Tax=Boudabousia liubingyangii TaxID=1921764 RepID=A0A1Q5PKW4_9ACTO|nr:ribosome small subunit-dependent GTPase A [Boudabousia liubingyangii]OKL47270.1 ribosome small subunit-dependent GTPase A [Boudabousia liubingyangii]